MYGELLRMRVRFRVGSEFCEWGTCWFVDGYGGEVAVGGGEDMVGGKGKG